VRKLARPKKHKRQKRRPTSHTRAHPKDIETIKGHAKIKGLTSADALHDLINPELDVLKSLQLFDDSD